MLALRGLREGPGLFDNLAKSSPQLVGLLISLTEQTSLWKYTETSLIQTVLNDLNYQLVPPARRRQVCLSAEETLTFIFVYS